MRILVSQSFQGDSAAADEDFVVVADRGDAVANITYGIAVWESLYGQVRPPIVYTTIEQHAADPPRLADQPLRLALAIV